jgi:hypothetical protein
MEFLRNGQMSLLILFTVFILTFSFLILAGIIFLKEINFSNLIIMNAKLFYNQLSILNLALGEIINNDYLPYTEKGLVDDDLSSYFSLLSFNPQTTNISGIIYTKAIKFPLEWKFNFTVEKINNNLKNLKIFIVN